MRTYYQCTIIIKADWDKECRNEFNEESSVTLFF